MHKLPVVAVAAIVTSLLWESPDGCAAETGVELVEVLRDWERCTGGLPQPLPDAAFPEFFESHTAHELDVAARLYGAVEARQLITDFNWSLESATLTTIVIKGYPRDEVAQLFFSSFEVTLDRQSVRPMLIQFFDADGDPRERPVRFRIKTARNHGGAGVTDPDVRTVARLPGEFSGDKPVPPGAELATILERWATASREIREAELRFRRYVYDRIYEQEIRGQGRFVFEAPGRGLYQLEPVEPDPTRQSQRTTVDGRPYDMISDERVSCFWTGTHLVWIDEEQRSYEMMPLPEANTGDIRPIGSWDRVWAGWAGPQRALPGVIDAHTDDFIERFDWSLLHRNESQIILQGRPKNDDDRFHLSLLQVVLDPETCLTSATRMVDAGGNRETVHVFEHVRINRSPSVQRPRWEPDLTQYQQVTAPPPAPPAEIED